MKISNLATKQARDSNGNSTKWFSKVDAMERNRVNKETYSKTVHARVDSMIDTLSKVYSNLGVFEAYGVRGVSVKVNRPCVSNPDALREIELAWQEYKVYKKVSPQGVIYRFDR
jgi:hypothetical protein